MRNLVALGLLASLTLGCGRSVRSTAGEGKPESAGTGGDVVAGPGNGAGGMHSAAGGGGAGGASTSGASAGGASAGGAAPAATCASVTTVTYQEPTPIPVIFVVDTSESLNDEVPGTSSTRWELTRDALAAAFLALPDALEPGLAFFPGELAERDLCLHSELAVPLAPAASAQREGLAATLEDVTPDGPAPTGDAYEFALRALDYRGVLVLVTDGPPDLGRSCGEPREDPWLEVQISIDHASRGHGVNTIVVGTWGSESERDALSDLAAAGALFDPDRCNDRDYCHIDLTTGADLREELVASLEPVRSGTFSCTFPLPLPADGTPPDVDDVRVLLTTSGADIELEAIESGAPCETGTFVLLREPPSEPRVELCPATCEAAISDPGAALTISAGCSRPP